LGECLAHSITHTNGRAVQEYFRLNVLVLPVPEIGQLRQVVWSTLQSYQFPEHGDNDLFNITRNVSAKVDQKYFLPVFLIIFLVIFGLLEAKRQGRTWIYNGTAVPLDLLVTVQVSQCNIIHITGKVIGPDRRNAAYLHQALRVSGGAALNEVVSHEHFNIGIHCRQAFIIYPLHSLPVSQRAFYFRFQRDMRQDIAFVQVGHGSKGSSLAICVQVHHAILCGFADAAHDMHAAHLQELPWCGQPHC